MTAWTTTDRPISSILMSVGILGRDQDSVDELARQIEQSPPRLFMCRADMTFDTSYGTRYTPEEIPEIDRRIRHWTDSAYKAGARYIMPYVCNQSIKGSDHNARTGIWEFWENWDKYEQWVGPRPEADPVDWLQREPDGHIHFNYPYRYQVTGLRYAPCASNPYWQQWMDVTIRRLAEHGYNGVFIDNNIFHCYCEHCRAGFKDFLKAEYTPEQLRERYGTDDVSDLELSGAGDKVLWAERQPEYMRKIHDEEPDIFERIFGTDSLEDAVVSEAGNGFHWGRSQTFWLSYLLEQCGSEEERERVLREADMSSLGMTTRAERCLWADTQKYWAWSADRSNASIRAAAEQVADRFHIMPNWGSMTGYRATDSRRLEAKNVRLWRGGTDFLFWEDDYYPGTIAPGYTFDLILPYKYALANGLRSCMLPYRGAEHEAIVDLAYAEAGAYGGDAAFQAIHSAKVRPTPASGLEKWTNSRDIPGPYDFPELRNRWDAFWERHADLFKDRESYADVGICLSFAELHMENMYHLRDAYPIADYLSDHHVLFDLIPEDYITAGTLKRFRVVIVPHMVFLACAARAELRKYLDNGGRVLFTGLSGRYDEHGREAESMRDWADGARAIWIEDVRDVMPRRAYDMHALQDLPVDDFLNDALPKVCEAAKSDPADNPALLERLTELAGTQLNLAPEAPPTLRITAWLGTGADSSMVVHLTNYDVPGPGMPPPVEHRAVDNVALSVPLSGLRSVRGIAMVDPVHPDPVELAFEVQAGRILITVPRVDTYCALHIE